LNEQQLRRLVEFGRGVLSELDLDVLLERVLEVACELTAAEYAALGVLDERRQELERFVTRGIDEETRQAIGDLPRGRGVLGTLIRDPRPLRISDVGKHPESWGFPSGHPRMTTFLGVPIMIRGVPYGNLYLTEKQGGDFTDADEEAMLVLADWAAIAIANAQAHGVVRNRRDELERALGGFEAAMEIVLAIGAETRLERVLELIVKRGRALVHARSMAVLVQDGDDIIVTAIAGELDPEVLGTRVPVAEEISGQVLRTRRPQRLVDTPTRLRAGLAGSIDAKAGLYVPMLYQGRALGVLNAFDRLANGPEFDREDERLMTAFASSAAVAIATAQSAEAHGLRRSIEAAERERTRWARELHDETLQELAALSIGLSAARSADGDELRHQIDASIARARAAADALRRLINELRPASLDQLGLAPALEALAARAQDLDRVKIDLTLDLAHEGGNQPARLAPEVENAVYRLVQEAVTNVVKHSGAGSARVNVTEDEGLVRVVVQDDGRGFTPSADTDGFGLIGMRERVTLLGGTIEVESTPGEGTTIVASIPIERRAASAEGRQAAL
jgi:signal transduction histidine kinase